MIDRADEAAATRQGQRGDEQQGPASDHRILARPGPQPSLRPGTVGQE